LVAIKQTWQTREVIFVWVTCDQHVNLAIPRRDQGIKLNAKARRIRPAVNQHPATLEFDKDCISLANI
jgi:hypothetical protein